MQCMTAADAYRINLQGRTPHIKFMSRARADMRENHCIIAWFQSSNAVIHGNDDPNTLVPKRNIAIGVAR